MASVYFWFELFFISGILFPLSFLLFILTFPFDKRRVVMHQYACIWSMIVLKINPLWRIKVNGREHIDRRETYIMVSNHQSGADIIVLFLLRSHFKWVAKRTLFYVPFIGWNMWLNNYIRIDRDKKTSMRKMMADAAKTLKEGNSVMIFPEGTRSKDGNIQPFKTGAFHLAINNQRPILPIAIKGTSQAVRKGGFLINRNNNISATILPPIPFSQFRDQEPKEVAKLVHDRIAAELAK